MPLYPANTNTFMVRGFRDPLATPRSSSWLNAAITHTWDLRTVENGGGTSVASGSLTYYTGSNGDYWLAIPHTTSLTLNNTYYLSTILQQLGFDGRTVQLKLEQPLVVVLRRGQTPNQ